MSRVRELSDFFEHLPVPLYRSAPDGALLAGNQALAGILGYESIEEVREAADAVTGFYTDPAVRDEWTATIESQGVVRDFDVELRRKDGQILWVRDTARAVFDESGNVKYYEGCLIDVTDRVRLERSRDRFIATVSHELRSPITAIYGLGREMEERRETFSDEEMGEMISLMTREAEEASWLIEDLLVAHRDDLGSVPIHEESFSLLNEVRRVVESVEANVPIDGGEGLEVYADPLRTRQILRNLVTNAERYGGDEVRVQIDSDNGSAQVAVCDSGDPIDNETLDHIFQPFVTAQRHAQSVGLGLWISSRLAELMNGGIVYEHDGNDSRFILSLPTA